MELFALLRTPGGRVNEAALAGSLRCRLNSVMPWNGQLVTGGVTLRCWRRSSWGEPGQPGGAVAGGERKVNLCDI